MKLFMTNLPLYEWICQLYRTIQSIHLWRERFVNRAMKGWRLAKVGYAAWTAAVDMSGQPITLSLVMTSS